MNNPELYGLTQSHLIELDGFLLTSATAIAFKQMQEAAAQDGIELAICSAFRDFDRQLAIWNGKASGQRPVLDLNSQAMDTANLSANELRDQILLWSALPGCSRHHWGTDLDVFDATQISKQALQLIPQEYQADAPCGKLNQWLTEHAHDYGFYRPFQPQLSGVQAEPWHLSYFPESDTLVKKFNTQELQVLLAESNIVLKQAILTDLTALVAHYVHFIAPSPKDSHSQQGRSQK